MAKKIKMNRRLMTTIFGYDFVNIMKCGKHGLTLMREMFNEH